MKNEQLKSVRRGSKSATAPQSKTQRAAVLDRSAGTVACVFTLPDGREWATVDFPRKVFSRIECAARKRGLTLQRFFDNAIHNYVASYNAKGGA